MTERKKWLPPKIEKIEVHNHTEGKTAVYVAEFGAYGPS